jgi:predicted metal-dependent hydrolase
MVMYDRLYVEFFYYFNIARDYFECHEVMEHFWLEEGRAPIYQGLLQVAVGLYHHQNNNVSGAIKLLTAALQKLDVQQEPKLGIDLKKLIEDANVYLQKLLQIEERPFAPYDIDIVLTDQRLQLAVAELIDHPPTPHED